MASKGPKRRVKTEKSSDSEFIQRFKAHPFISIGTIFVLVIVIVAFVLVPTIGSGMGKMPDYTFGYYDKIPISYVPGNFFAQIYANYSQYYRNMGDMYNNIFFEQQMWRNSYEAAAYRIAVLQEMKKSGYSVPTETIDKEVARQFIADGRFYSEAYDKYDKNSRLSLWRMTADDVAVRMYQSDLEGLYKPEQAAQYIANMALVRRSFDLVSFPVNAYPDSEIASYAEEHADLFRQTHLSRITVVSGEREAKEILKSINEGATTFEDAARAHSQDSYSERGGDMGIKPVHELVQEIPDEKEREQVLALGKDQLSNVINIDKNWIIFRAEETVQPVDTNDPSIIDRVRSYIQTFELSRMEDWAINEADKFITLVNEKGFDEAVFENNLTRKSFGPIPINYGNVDLFESLSSASIPELSASSDNENFWKAAFGTKINTPSEPLVQGSNVLVLYPTGEEQADQEAIESIKTAYENYWINNTVTETTRQHFFNSSKMDDRFYEAFQRIFKSE